MVPYAEMTHCVAIMVMLWILAYHVIHRSRCLAACRYWYFHMLACLHMFVVVAGTLISTCFFPNTFSSPSSSFSLHIYLSNLHVVPCNCVACPLCLCCCFTFFLRGKLVGCAWKVWSPHLLPLGSHLTPSPISTLFSNDFIFLLREISVHEKVGLSPLFFHPHWLWSSFGPCVYSSPFSFSFSSLWRCCEPFLLVSLMLNTNANFTRLWFSPYGIPTRIPSLEM